MDNSGASSPSERSNNSKDDFGSGRRNYDAKVENKTDI